MSLTSLPRPEAVAEFACFGGICRVLVAGSGPAGSAEQAAGKAKRRLRDWHGQFSRFEPSSELSRLNSDRRERVPVSPMMARFLKAAIQTAELTNGLVDPTLLAEVEQAGYRDDFVPQPDERAPSDMTRRPARPHPEARWRHIAIDPHVAAVTRPPGVQLDSGGVAKGLFGDVLATVLSWHQGFVVEAAGDVRWGGRAGAIRPVHIESPFGGGGVLHTFELARGAVATSGTTKRRWTSSDGQLAHHLLDPATGQPAFTGVIQASALAPTGVEAEARAKAALLAGPSAAPGWLPYGGLVVHEGGAVQVFEPAAGWGRL